MLRKNFHCQEIGRNINLRKILFPKLGAVESGCLKRGLKHLIIQSDATGLLNVVLSEPLVPNATCVY